MIPLSMIGMPLPASGVPMAKVHKRIVVLHYLPIRDTVVEESPASFASRFKPVRGTIASLCCNCRLAWLMPTTRHQKARRHGRVILISQCRCSTRRIPLAVSSERDSGDTVVGRKICRPYKKPRDWKHWPHRFAAVYSARCLLHEPKPCQGRVRRRHV